MHNLTLLFHKNSYACAFYHDFAGKSTILLEFLPSQVLWLILAAPGFKERPKGKIAWTTDKIRAGRGEIPRFRPPERFFRSCEPVVDR